MKHKSRRFLWDLNPTYWGLAVTVSWVPADERCWGDFPLDVGFQCGPYTLNIGVGRRTEPGGY